MFSERELRKGRAQKRTFMAQHDIEEYMDSYPDYWLSVEEGAGRGRVNRFINQDKVPFFIISAWRGENTAKENRRRSKALIAKLRSYHLGAVPLWGKWKEKDRETGEERLVRERSFLVVKSSNISDRKFKEIAIKLMKEFGQEAIIFGDGEAVYILCNRSINTGCKEQKIGNRVTFDLDKIEDVFSTIRGAPFTFESAYIVKPRSFAGAVGLRGAGFYWSI